MDAQTADVTVNHHVKIAMEKTISKKEQSQPQAEATQILAQAIVW